MKVLVVHRQEAVLKGIEAQMIKWSVKAFLNGMDALITARSESFDLILCGQDLPVVTGIELVRSLRNFSVNKTTPVILLADGTETIEHMRIMGLLNANLLTMKEVEEMENMTIS
jgi:DNA-binding response OmpR family regulator